ncbi:Fic family protein [Kyrpidia tusciae]|uniref:helix-turn-helix domain-containing protein n=1 Tax=Kyrpidia tusciae TaxID=33943 RepID=UPI00031D2994|nr:helix-turn-helix domain-containing protein [Kyrpidia tusciae]
MKYFLTVILEAYRRFEQRVELGQEHQKRGWKQARIEQVVLGFVADFTISDVEELCPGISRPTITRVLNKMSKSGHIHCVEKGRNARWVKNPEVTIEC